MKKSVQNLEKEASNTEDKAKKVILKKSQQTRKMQQEN